MFLVGSPLFNPLAENLLLGCSDRLVGFRRRHDGIRVLRLQPLPQFARFQVTRSNGYATFFVGCEGSVGGVETKPGFALLRVQSMTGKTVVRQDGSNVPIEGQVGRQGRSSRNRRHRRNPPEYALNHAIGKHDPSVSGDDRDSIPQPHDLLAIF